MTTAISGIIENVEYKTNVRPFDLVTIKCQKPEKRIYTVCYTFFSSIRKGDQIKGELISDNNGNYYFSAEPTTEIGISEESIRSMLYRAFYSQKVPSGRINALYEFFQTETLHYITLNKNNVKDPIIQHSKTDASLALYEMINDYCYRYQVDRERTLQSVSSATMIDSVKIEKMFFWWYKSQYMRRFYLLGLCDTDIEECTELISTGELYYQLMENPYQVLELNYEKCNKIANKYNIVFDNEYLSAAQNSHQLYEETKKRKYTCLPKAVCKRFYGNVTEQIIEKCIEYFDYEIRYDCLYSPVMAKIEKFFAQNLQNKPLVDDKDELLSVSNMCNELQRHAIYMALTNKISIISGGPGTGKTFIIKILCNLFARMGASHFVGSFTGKAVQRIRECFENVTADITTLDYYCISSLKFKKYDYFVIDESSMVATKLMFKTLRNVFEINPDANIIFIGDPYQLEPISQGSFFVQICQSRIPQVCLEVDCRREKSTLQNNIEYCIEYNKTNDISILSRFEWKDNCNIYQGNKEILPRAVNYYKEKLVPEMQITDISRAITILTLYRTDLPLINAQIRPLFINLQETMNILDEKGNIWYTGDRVMCTKNDDTMKIFNGQEGVIEKIDLLGKKVHIRFGLDVVVFPTHTERADASKNAKVIYNFITLSWAITIDKSQGSEWNTVILYLPLVRNSSSFINRKRFFTAISRSKQNFCCIYENFENVQYIMSAQAPIRSDNTVAAINCVDSSLALTNEKDDMFEYEDFDMM